MSTRRFTGVRVLVAEDQMIVAMQIEDVLHEAGCDVLGPVVTLESALALAERISPDAAILDVNLSGEHI